MINKTIVKQSLTAITIGMLFFSSTINSATYDLFGGQTANELTPIGKSAGRSFFNFDFERQAQIANNKEYYRDTLKLIKNKRFKEAGSRIDSLLKENPADPELYNLQGLLAIFKKETTQSIKSYRKSIELDPKNITAHLALSKLYLDINDLNQAKEYAKKALVIDDKPSYAYFILADIANRQKQPKEMENLLLTAQSKNRGNFKQEIAVANNLGKLYALQKHPKKALLLAQDIVNRYPDESSALSLLAGAQIINNQNELAEQTLEKLVNKDEKDIQHRLLLARLWVAQSEKEKNVLRLLDEISAITPDNPQILIQKAAFLIKLKHYREAKNVIAKVNKLTPQMAVSYLLEGEIYLAEKKLDQALSAYQKAYAIKPNDKILYLISDILMAKGKSAEAIGFLDQELKKHNGNLTIHFKLATVFQQQNNLIEAEKHYKTILASDPENALVLNNLAWLYLQKNNPEALALAERAYQLASDSASVADTYGSVLVKQGHLKRGISVLEKATELAPGAYDIQYHLAEAYSSNGKPQQAIKILQRIIETEQDFPEKNAAITLLKALKGN